MILRGHFFSTTLEMETGISLLLPKPGSGRQPSKVVYLLHGLCGRSGDWIDYTMLPQLADQYQISFVMPEVARSFYADMRFGQKFFTYITEELPTTCQSLFNISPRREDCAIIGASMGGYGALKCALNKPEQYGYCAAFAAPCLFLKEGLDYQRQHGESEELKAAYGQQLLTDFTAIFGPDLQWDPRCDILHLARDISRQALKPAIYLACGTGDFLHADNQRFKTELEKLPLPFVYEEWPGTHDWQFFNAALTRALSFVFADHTSP
jgi:S-formylglutathione hydrolase FrmB